MFEVIGAIVESAAGYVGGKFTKGKISIFQTSILVGAIFFIGYIFYELHLSFNINVKDIAFLAIISALVSALTYGFLVSCVWFEKRKR